jgi:NAD(P)-dependent dehydrogenase (short-subunit alcohol dehydrogenase family)
LGYQTASILAKRGALVILACRSVTKATEAINSIKKEIPDAKLEFIELDLGSFDSIHKCAKFIREKYPKFDCLINNAGVASREEKLTHENIEQHTGINHLGHFLLTNLLLKEIKENNSRVVVVSSKLFEKAKIDFDNFGLIVTESKSKKPDYYANSKLMNFYFAKELYKRKIDAHVLCPGLCLTDLFREFNLKFYHYILFSPIILFFLRSAKQGAQNIVFCATDSTLTKEKNPDTSYIVMNLKQHKSKVDLSDDISTRLWNTSVKWCKLDENESSPNEKRI